MDLNIQKVFSKSRLFDAINPFDYLEIISCLNGQTRTFDEHEFIFDCDENIDRMGIILEGAVDFNVIKSDGNINLIRRLYPSDSMGEVFACSGMQLKSFEYLSVQKTKVMFLDIPRACTDKVHCNHTKKYKVMENMLKVIAEDNIFLNKKMFILSQRKLRDKLLSYIYLFKAKDSKEMWVPFNRQELADFISADRSAVSRELNKMKKDGILEINSNMIRIL